MPNQLWNLANVIRGSVEAEPPTEEQERDDRLDAMWHSHLTLSSQQMRAQAVRHDGRHR